MSYSSEVLADSPRAYYHFDEASGNPQDSSGNAMHCTVVNFTPTYQQPAAASIGGFSYRNHSSSLDSFSAPDNNLLDLGDVFSLEAWIKLATIGIANGIISKGTGAYYLRIATDNTLNLLRSQTADVVHSTTTISDTTTWHHVVATKNGATSKLYIDSVDVTGTPTNSTFADTATPLQIGGDVGGENFDGFIDEVAVYPTELSAARVLAHYNAGQGIVTAGTQIIQVRSGLRLS